MKKTYFIVLLLICIVSCDKKEKKQIFNSIDYSYSDGWTYPYSIKINNDGKIFILEEKRIFDLVTEQYTVEKTFVQSDLFVEEIDSLSSLLMNINYNDMDTLYWMDCVDCEMYYLIINKEAVSIKLFVHGIYDYEKSTEIHKIQDYLNFLKQRVIMDSKLLKFESKTRAFNLVPPLPNTKKLIK